jgi:CRP/FNR family transcriptional regulator
MDCGNSECPFFSAGTGTDGLLATGQSCLVGDSIKQVRFDKDEIVFSQDQPGCCIYTLTSGVAKICYLTQDGHERIVGFATRHRLLMGLQSLSNDCYVDSAIALTPVTACKITRRALLVKVAERPDVALALIQATSIQLRMARALMRVMEHHGAAAKLAAFLLHILPESDNIEQRFDMPLSRLEIADILGLSEETVCRQMASMKRDGILYAPRGSIEVHNWDRLREIASEPQAIH